MRPETEAALAAVDAALRIMASRLGAESVRFKGPADPVTETDVRTEDAVRAALLGRFPAFPVVGEERGGEPPADGRPYWLVDPICGTENFASGLPLYAVNVALVAEGHVSVAVVGDGGRGERYVAERAAGARLLSGSGARPLRVANTMNTVSLDMGSAAGDRATFVDLVRLTLLQGRYGVRMLGTGLAAAYLAAGHLAAHLVLSGDGPVHTAAGALVAQEAGARVTDLAGRPWSPAARSFLGAATPDVHEDVLALLQQARGRRAGS